MTSIVREAQTLATGVKAPTTSAKAQTFKLPLRGPKGPLFHHFENAICIAKTSDLADWVVEESVDCSSENYPITKLPIYSIQYLSLCLWQLGSHQHGQ